MQENFRRRIELGHHTLYAYGQLIWQLIKLIILVASEIMNVLYYLSSFAICLLRLW